MVKLPSLPDPDSVFSVFDKASNAIDKGLDLIGKLEGKLDKISGTESKPTLATFNTPKVTDRQTLAYQLDHIFTPLRQLELHLSEECKILEVSCDCCGKSAGDIRIFSAETIPIAARVGIDTAFFAELANWASYIEQIGTEANSASGKYGETYRKESGTASNYRKRVQAMLAELGMVQAKSESAEECPTCEKVRTLKEHLEQRKRGREASD